MTSTTQLPAKTEQHHHPPPARTVDPKAVIIIDAMRDITGKGLLIGRTLNEKRAELTPKGAVRCPKGALEEWMISSKIELARTTAFNMMQAAREFVSTTHTPTETRI